MSCDTVEWGTNPIGQLIDGITLFDKALQKQTNMHSKNKGPSINYVVSVGGEGR